MLDGSSRRRRRSAEECGAAAVEFAILMPVLLAIVYGIITFGIIFSQQLALGNAARQGARFGVVANRTCDDIVTETKQSAVALAMPSAAVTVSVTRDGGFSCTDPAATPCAGSSSGQSVHVEASFSSDPLLPLVATDAVDLVGEGSFRCEFS